MTRPRSIAPALARWFRATARPFPWRDAPHGSRDPWRVLVSETMAQQTQVARVAERYPAFLRRFPSASAMAAAPEADVLAAWAGLGYYRRARHLHAASVRIVREFGGRVPADPASLRSLPGVGRYTAGAVASLAFGAPEPVVDGNVSRVLLRVHGRAWRSDEPRAVDWAWEQAGALVASAASRRIPPGELNEALMELGATVCTPASPRCDACPLARACEARKQGTQASIPRPRARPASRRLTLTCLVVRDARGRVLMERSDGLWAGLWRPITPAEAWTPADAGPHGALCARWVDAGGVTRVLSHRRVVFRVWAGRARPRTRAAGGRRWLSAEDIHALGVSTAHRVVIRAGLEALRAATGTARRRPR